jgi:hypothetical protein
MRAAQLGAPRQSAVLGGKQAVREAERRFPVRIRIAVPPEGLGSRLDQIIAWLDANCGADGWAITPSGICGVVNDALVDGVYRGCYDEPRLWIGAALHKTP